MTVLNLFPARIPFVNNDGTLTDAAFRALQIVFERVGGFTGDSGADVFGQVFGASTDSASNLSIALSDTVQPVDFGSTFYGDVVQFPTIDMTFTDVMQPVSRERDAGIFTTIDVSGNAAIGGTLKLSPGTVAAPSLYWLTDATTGFYRIGANNIGFSYSGTKLLDLLGTGLAVYGAINTTRATGGLIVMDSTALATTNTINSTLNTGATYAPLVLNALSYSFTIGGAPTLAIGASGATISGTATVNGGATFLTTSTALTNGAGAAAGTISNAPTAGNPTKWIGINDNGVTRLIPSW